MSIKTFGAEVLKESISGVAGYVIYEGGEALDLPTGVNMALSMAGTVAVYKTVDGCILKIGKSADEIIDLTKVQNTVVKGDNITNVSKMTSPEVKSAIEKYGLSVEEFSELLNPNKILTPDELSLVDCVRSEIGLPQPGTVMNKTIPQRDIYNYLYNERYSGVRGFVSVDEHSNTLKTLEDVFEGNRLDYDNTAFKVGIGVDGISQSVGAPDTVYGKITYVLDGVDSIKVPTDFPTVENAPYTGRGLLVVKILCFRNLYRIIELSLRGISWEYMIVRQVYLFRNLSLIQI